MKPLKSLISLEECRHILLDSVKPIQGVEEADLTGARGRVLAEPLQAGVDVPPFRRAAMDGYAVRAGDTYGAGNMSPRKLRRIESIHAGETPTRRVEKGTCTQIATGAPMPEGADAVVMVEDTEAQGEAILIYDAIHPGGNSSPAGEDIRRGTTILPAGAMLDPAKVGVAAALGVARVKVYRRPRVAVIPSGNEVVPPGGPLPAGKIYDVNTYTLSTLLAEHGAEPRTYPVALDTLASVKGTLEKALRECDMVVLSGGSSVGEKDLMVEAIGALGEVKFHGIAVKPGKPTLGAVARGKLILGMPGYPTSCLTNGYGVLVPVVRRLARLPPWEPRIQKVPMSRRITSTIGRHQFLPVRIQNGEAVPVFKESGAITSMSEADGYIEIPANVDLVEKGEMVEVKLF
ncbi:MAG: molybdenum cofactor biosynthesis protein [Euryarchaeota archaeon]|nr:molybdenum cofactor biosynthesis protein [Euryarchaeota archaeon]